MLYTGIILSFDIRCCLQAYVLLQSKKKTGTSLLILAECEREYCMFHPCDFVSLHFGLHQMLKKTGVKIRKKRLPI